MNIKIPEYLLKMPTYLPNDIEGMIFTYPNKFPLIKEKYEEQYLKAGLALAFSTHKRRNVEHGTTNQWLLVGMLRINDEPQKSLF